VAARHRERVEAAEGFHGFDVVGEHDEFPCIIHVEPAYQHCYSPPKGFRMHHALNHYQLPNN